MDRKRELLVVIITAEEKEKKEQKGVAKTTPPHTHKKKPDLWKWKSLSHVWLCDPMDSTAHGILQARILEWATFSFSRESSQPRDQTQVYHIAGRFFTSWVTASRG